MLNTDYVEQKASNRAPFVFLTTSIVLPLLLLLFSFNASAELPAANCSANNFHETVKVNQVYDGDTLELTDGRKLRLVGINTPERGSDSKSDEPFYTLAKEQLEKIIEHNNGQLKLLYDIEQHDKYNRVLAHIFTANGSNITATLLKEGLGFSIAIPPNLKFLDCYQFAENEAKQLNQGIWGHSFAKPIEAVAMTPSTQGFRQVTGTVKRIGESRSSVWLTLSNRFSIRIPKKDLLYFSTYQPATLIHKRIIASSWIYKQNKEQRMLIRHPASIQILNAD